ncbi:hypothetical protein [Flavobacterium rhizosphaerae]|uniref:Uncharacterized protein n=1 Tax=Flavobacterium rhizosphaerae TaxID=3163298 RepID=A0ABW8YZW8_9FLAO
MKRLIELIGYAMIESMDPENNSYWEIIFDGGMWCLHIRYEFATGRKGYRNFDLKSIDDIEDACLFIERHLITKPEQS